MDDIVEVPGVARRLRVFAYAAATLVACCATDAAGAAKVYRCGNAFQDRPCDAATPGDVRSPDKATPPAPTKAVARVDANERPVVPPASSPAADTGSKAQRPVGTTR